MAVSPTEIRDAVQAALDQLDVIIVKWVLLGEQFMVDSGDKELVQAVPEGSTAWDIEGMLWHALNDPLDETDDE